MRMVLLPQLQEATWRVRQQGLSSAALQQQPANDIVDLLPSQRISTIIMTLTAFVSSAR